MTPDLERMMRRVVSGVFDEDVEVAWNTERATHILRVTLSAERGTDRRSARLSAANTGWFDISILDLDVSAFLVEYDDES